MHTHTHKPVHVQDGASAVGLVADDNRGGAWALSMLSNKRHVNVVHFKIIQDEAEVNKVFKIVYTH